MDESSFERLLNIQSYTDEELRDLAAKLAEEEREISKRRRILHGEIDIVRAELVRRLRDKSRDGRLVVDADVGRLAEILRTRGRPAEDALGEGDDSR